jgi:elongator complex protein 1
LTKYVNSILTAFVVKRPPDYESALSLLHDLRGDFFSEAMFRADTDRRIIDTNQEMVEDAVKYVIFLVDVDKLFDTALGMYDFSLVLLIAQQSQRVSRVSLWNAEFYG